MVSVRSILREIPDSRGKKGRLHRLEAILGLILTLHDTVHFGVVATGEKDSCDGLDPDKGTVL